MAHFLPGTYGIKLTKVRTYGDKMTFWRNFQTRKLVFSSGFIIFFAAISLYLYSAHFRVAGFFHDDGIYIVNAKSLHEGTGYRIVSLPGSPPQTKYPPVLPLILSLCWLINPSFPENILLMRLFSALCAVVVLFLSWFYLHQKTTYTALPVFLFLSALALNHEFVFFSGQILSEMPFTLFSLASIVLFLHYESSGRKSALYGSLLFATIAFYTRTIGIALFLSFLLWFLCQRRLKASLGALAVMLCAIVPWFCWGYENSASTSSLPAYYGSYSSWFLENWSSSSSYLPNILVLFTLPSLLFLYVNVHPVSLSIVLSLIFMIFFWVFFLTGIRYQFRKSPQIDTLYLLVTVFIVAVWPPGFSRRLFFPLLPIVLFHLMEGVKVARKDVITLSPACRRVARPLWHAGVAVLVVGIFLAGIAQSNKYLRCMPANNEASFLHVEEACDWIRSNTEMKDVIAFYVDPLIYLLAGRPSINVAFDSPGALTKKLQNPYKEDDILGAIKKHGVAYVLITSFHLDESNKFFDKKLSEIIKKYPDAFHKCYEKKRAVAIYRVKRQYLVDEGNSSISAKLFLPRRD